MSGIEIRDVTKSFGKVNALDHVSLTFAPDKIYGLLGRNGAGKSTLLNIITNRMFPDSGLVTMDGEPMRERDALLGKVYLMSEKTFYPDSMRVQDAFRWSKTFYPDFDEAYAKRIAEQFELDIKKRVKTFSTGFSSIFKLVIALSVNTPYVFLDEPVLGLDANNRDLFYRLLIEKYTENPFTIVISTHLIDEVANVIEDVVIIKEGRVICEEPRETLLSRAYTVSGPAGTVDAFAAGREVLGAEALGGYKAVHILGDAPESLPDGLEKSQIDLQKLFVQLTNV